MHVLEVVDDVLFLLVLILLRCLQRELPRDKWPRGHVNVGFNGGESDDVGHRYYTEHLTLHVYHRRPTDFVVGKEP